MGWYKSDYFQSCQLEFFELPLIFFFSGVRMWLQNTADDQSLEPFNFFIYYYKKQMDHYFFFHLFFFVFRLNLRPIEISICNYIERPINPNNWIRFYKKNFFFRKNQVFWKGYDTKYKGWKIRYLGGAFARLHLSLGYMHNLFLLLPEIPSVFRLVQNGPVCHASTERFPLFVHRLYFSFVLALQIGPQMYIRTRRGVDISSAP